MSDNSLAKIVNRVTIMLSAGFNDEQGTFDKAVFTIGLGIIGNPAPDDHFTHCKFSTIVGWFNTWMSGKSQERSFNFQDIATCFRSFSMRISYPDGQLETNMTLKRENCVRKSTCESVPSRNRTQRENKDSVYWCKSLPI